MVLSQYPDAQFAIVPTDTDVESKTGKLSCIAWQIAYHLLTGVAGSITEGVQQVLKDSIENVVVLLC